MSKCARYIFNKGVPVAPPALKMVGGGFPDAALTQTGLFPDTIPLFRQALHG